MKKSYRIVRAGVAAAVAGWSAGVFASGFALSEQNASGLGNAYAGQAAAAENASTIFFNPAGMAQLPGTQASGTLSFINPSANFRDNGLSMPPGGRPLGDNGGDAGSLAYVPAAYLSWQFNPSLWFGVGITAPFGLKTTYDALFIGRFQGRENELKVYDINPSVAWKVYDWLSVGGGFSYQHANIKTQRAVSFVASEGLLNLDANDSKWGFNLGAMMTFGPGTRVGLAYRSTMSYQFKGTAAVTGAVTATPTIFANVRMPDTWSAAFDHKLNDSWELVGDFTWTNWSTIKDVPITTTSASALGGAGTVLDTINFQFKDTYRLGLGANYRWTGDTTVKLGIAHDKSPVGDAVRTVILPDSDRTWLALGGKYLVSKAGTLDFGYAHLFVKNGSISQNQGTAVAAFQRGFVNGTYRNYVNIVSVQYTHSF